MENVKCDACGRMFKVDPRKQRHSKGLRCPHCLTPVVLAGKVGAFADYVAGSKAVIKTKPDSPAKPLEVTRSAQILWAILGTLFLVACIALAIFVIVSGYPFSSPLELNPAGG